MTILQSNSDESTAQLGRALAPLLQDGMVVALQGELGAGKTVLSRGIARGLGVIEAVTSPTFTVAQEYALAEQRFFYHLDMYRIDGEQAALAFGIDEFLFAPRAITVVEWPERIRGLLPESPELLILKLRHLSEGSRLVLLPEKIFLQWFSIGLPSGISCRSAKEAGC